MQRTRRGVAEFIYLVVDLQVLFYISIGTGDVCFGLVVVVVRHEELYAVVREKLAHLVAKLRGERFIMREYERGATDVPDDVSHRESLAAAGHAQKHLSAQTVLYALGKFRDRFGLISRRLVFGYEFEFVFHDFTLPL